MHCYMVKILPDSFTVHLLLQHMLDHGRDWRWLSFFPMLVLPLVCLLSLTAPLPSFAEYNKMILHVPVETQEESARGLVRRLLPDHFDNFHLRVVDHEDEAGWWRVRDSDKRGVVVVRGNSGVSVASGVYWYLTDRCGCHISWSGVHSVVLHGFLGLGQMEREIDWMALHGINMPLAFNGQEMAWVKVFRSYNISLGDLRDFFVGPAFYAWQRMRNIQGWAGPSFSTSAHTKRGRTTQSQLQQRIIQRMRSLV
mmetsp:Transcript_56307/g.122391  ORF Transcript_56307/g.122391 Transcript_56307/m.122391 type:complete len:253 (-) Transcript_56307:120-878(-)